jgi:hypothetical protein
LTDIITSRYNCHGPCYRKAGGVTLAGFAVVSVLFAAVVYVLGSVALASVEAAILEAFAS